MSVKCIDWYEFDLKTKIENHPDIYQVDIPQKKLNEAVDMLNYIIEALFFDSVILKIVNIYFGFETRQHMFLYPAFLL